MKLRLFVAAMTPSCVLAGGALALLAGGAARAQAPARRAPRLRRPAHDSHHAGGNRSLPPGAAQGGGRRRHRRRPRDRDARPGHLGHLPPARPGVVPRRSPERRHGVLVGALVAGRRAGRRQDQGRPRGERRRADRRRALRDRPRRGPGAVAHVQGLRRARRRPPVRQRDRGLLHRAAGDLRIADRGRAHRQEPRDPDHGHGRLAHDGGHQDGLRLLAAGLLARRRRDRVHVVPARQSGPVDRVGGRRARAPRVEAAGPEHRRGLDARAAAASRSRCRTKGTPRSIASAPARA